MFIFKYAVVEKTNRVKNNEQNCRSCSFQHSLGSEGAAYSLHSQWVSEEALEEIQWVKPLEAVAFLVKRSYFNAGCILFLNKILLDQRK